MTDLAIVLQDDSNIHVHNNQETEMYLLLNFFYNYTYLKKNNYSFFKRFLSIDLLIYQYRIIYLLLDLFTDIFFIHKP